MTGTVLDFDQRATVARPAVSDAPALPIERHIVAAALAAERIRALAAQVLIVLQHAPRHVEAVSDLQTEILMAGIDLDMHHGAYRALLECEGQA